jgi:beta-N-acetylhexosaminidase
LREDLAFDGVAVSDAIGMAAVKARYGLAGAAVRALAAGIDLVCVDSGTTDAEMTELTDAIGAAVRDGSLPEARLVEAAGRVAQFAAWRRKVRETDSATPPSADGLAAARSAVRILRSDGNALPVTHAPHVVEAQIPGSFAAQLAELLPGTTHAPLTDASGVPEDRPLVIVVRAVQRSPQDLELVRALLTARPDGVVVELGVPHVDPGGAAWIASFGASRVCMRAAAEVLAGAA